MFHILDADRETCGAPACLEDLNLSRFLEGIIQKETWLDLRPWFYTPVSGEDRVCFRQAILKDLRKGDNLTLLDRFSEEICRLARQEEQAEQDLQSGEPWRCHDLLYGQILENGETYVRLVRDLRERLPEMGFASEGLRKGADYLQSLTGSAGFQNLAARQQALRRDLNGIEYIMQIRYGVIRVKKYEGEEDISQKILSAFQKFQQEDQRDYRQDLGQEPYAPHVEAAVLRCLSRLWPREFEALHSYGRDCCRVIPEQLRTFCRELRFYIDWLRAIGPMESWGLPFCIPEFTEGETEFRQTYDLVLADQIGSAVVKNDLLLRPQERILVITGPNQGGKTTFARALGQLYYLASLGLCVPGTAARIPLRDRVLTHFPREESEVRGSGRLQEELLRLRELLGSATDRSLLILNEIFASTSARDGAALGRQMLGRIRGTGCMAVLVTFLGELAEEPGTVSLVSTVDPADPCRRTFLLERRPPEEMTYAMTLARKHGLSYAQVLRRMGP